VYKENRWLPRIIWFIAIMALGNMAMAAYILKELYKLRKLTLGDQDAIKHLLIAQNG